MWHAASAAENSCGDMWNPCDCHKTLYNIGILGNYTII